MNIKSFVPGFCRAPIRKFYLAVSYARPSSSAAHFCPTCNRGLSRFRTDARWHDQRCVFCNSGSRQRMIWLFFNRCTDLFNGAPKKVLHIAPEVQFDGMLAESIGEGYITADLFDPRARVKMDITDIQYPPESFDVILCSHVLEHVSDDAKAMREFVRVLKPKGWAAILVPCYPDLAGTLEDLSVTDPAERLRLFGQEDHVRKYGNDFVNRLEKAGFEVRVVSPSEFLSPREMTRFHIAGSGDVFLCTRPRSQSSQISTHS